MRGLNKRMRALEIASGADHRAIYNPEHGADHAAEWRGLRAKGVIPLVVRYPGIDDEEHMAACDAFMRAGRELGYVNDAGELLR